MYEYLQTDVTRKVASGLSVYRLDRETKQTSKRGFPTKREAQMWEHEQMLKHDAKLDMTFASFYEIYVEDKKGTNQG